MLYKKQFRSQKNHSTDHPIIQLLNQISNSFEKNNFTLDVFMDLSNAFDTIDHMILIKKLHVFFFISIVFFWLSLNMLRNMLMVCLFFNQKSLTILL